MIRHKLVTSHALRDYVYFNYNPRDIPAFNNPGSSFPCIVEGVAQFLQLAY